MFYVISRGRGGRRDGSHPGRVLLRLRGEFGFLVGALPGRGTAWCEGVGIGSHPGRVLLRSGGEFGLYGRSTAGSPDRPVRRGGLEFAPGAGAPTAERVLVSAFDQSRSSRVTVMSWRDTSTFQKV